MSRSPSLPFHQRAEIERARLGLTKDGLARQAGIGRVTYDRLAASPRPPQSATVAALCKTLSIPLDEGLQLAGVIDTDEQLAPWRRLGDLLVNRRVQLDPRYTNRRTFADETHGGKQDSWYRVITSIETGGRTNYARETLAAVERAYKLEPGTLVESLDSGALTARASARVDRTEAPEQDLLAVAGSGFVCCWCLTHGDAVRAVTLVAGSALCGHHAREELNRE